MQENVERNHDYWNDFYAARNPASRVSDEPSPFAEWVATQIDPGQPIVEFGFGTGRDALWFAANGHPVTGYDYAHSAVELAQSLSDSRELPATFHALDLYDSAAVKVQAKSLSAGSTNPVVYGRFLIHALESNGRWNLLDLAASSLENGGALYLEFRTAADEGQQHIFGDDHFRVYLDPETVGTEIKERGGQVTHSETGHGLAVYKSEDPAVARIVASWEA